MGETTVCSKSLNTYAISAPVLPVPAVGVLVTAVVAVPASMFCPSPHRVVPAEVIRQPAPEASGFSHRLLDVLDKFLQLGVVQRVVPSRRDGRRRRVGGTVAMIQWPAIGVAVLGLNETRQKCYTHCTLRTLAILTVPVSSPTWVFHSPERPCRSPRSPSSESS